MIFYGPSRTGNTTIANIIAAQTDRTLVKLNGTLCSTADIKEAISKIGTMTARNGILMYLDEILYINKKEQRTLLQ